MSFRVRAARAEDAEAAVHLLRRSIAELCQADHQNDPERLAGWLANKRPEVFIGWLEDGQSTVILTEGEQGQLLGVAMCHHAGHITLNYVSPDARFAGISSALVSALEAVLKGHGLRHVSLVSTRTAHAFYLARGYRDVIDAGAASNELKMQKELPA
jgi:GNAT superfamily N-acetyltransferase